MPANEGTCVTATAAKTRPAASASADLERGRRLLRAESEALAALEAALDERFAAALDRLTVPHGRVVVTGMGKSGHVARKIAATMASTGTPALFVHPAEASHGDLGMIGEADAVLALSNSGETRELADVVAYTRRFAIPLVGMTGRAPSALADASDVALVLPRVPEACPLGLAPTTSTTMMLAMGDALAVALLERRGFTQDDFGKFHPGGKLGARLTKVRELMHAGDALPLTTPDAAVAEAIAVIGAKRLGCVGVVDASGALVGIVTDGDLRRNIRPSLLTDTVASVMTRAPKTIRADALAAEAVRLMNEKSITVVFAMEGVRPVGVLHMHDCLRAGLA
jgi:arabinose-5-phosphate isomerase